MQHSIAAHFAAWPARYVHPAATCPRAAPRPAPGVGVHRGSRPADGAASTRRRPADGAARPVAGAHDRARAHQRAAAGRRRPRGCGGPAPPAQVDRDAPPWRPRGPPEAGQRHLRGWHRHPVHRRHARARGRQAPAGARRRHLDPPQGHADPDETTEQTAVREVCEETGLEVRIVRAFDFIEYCSSRAGRGSARRPLLPDGADRAATSRVTTTSSPRCAGSRSARRRSLLTFETERALVARAAAVGRDRRLVPDAGLQVEPRRMTELTRRCPARCSTATRRWARRSSSSPAG